MRKKILLGVIFILFSGCSLINGYEQTSRFEDNLITYPINEISQKNFKNELRSQREVNQFLLIGEEILDNKLLTVTSKSESPSGNPNDYVSLGPYWWPDPESTNGLPYIFKGGKRNPEIRNLDAKKLVDLTYNLRDLSIAFTISGEEKFAQKAIQYLKYWFLNPQTRMNPHMQYAQGIPGITNGRPEGIIEAHHLIYILDYIKILRDSSHWSKNLERDLYSWYNNFLKWMVSSPMGKTENSKKNNHGSWYDVQVVAIADALNKDKFAESILNQVNTQRIEQQIEENGEQPYELRRSRGLSYSIFNLRALIYLAKLGEEYNIDIWNYPTKRNSKLINAINYLIPFIFEEEKWPHKQSTKINKCEFLSILNAVYNFTGEIKYKRRFEELSKNYCQSVPLQNSAKFLIKD